MNIIKAPIESVIPWDKNPRGIKTKDYERLKKQILKLGVYKPLVCYEDKGKYVVLGGNMRIRALKDTGLKEVDISVVSPKTEAEKIEFALSDEVIKRIIGVAGNPFILAWNTGDNQADCLPMIADQTAMIHGLGLTYLDTIIWKKAGAVYSIPRSAHIRTHQYYYPALAWEPIVIFRKGELMPKFDAADVERVSKYGINVWEMNQVIGSQQDKIGHPAIYPLELPTRVMMAYTTSGTNILDPFLGSGTTLIAAEKLNRICYGMEIDPKYCDVIIKRYADYVGVEEKAIRKTVEHGK